MSRRARVWLVERAGPVPPSLQARMEDAAEAVSTGRSAGRDTAAPAEVSGDIATDLAADLAEAALHCLRSAVRHGDDRAAAQGLLAADALVTFACETAADAGADAAATLDRLCAVFGAARLDELMPGEAR